MEDFPGIALTFTQPIDMRVSEMLTGVRGDLAIKLYGPDLPTLNRLASEIESVVEGVPGAEDTITIRNEGVQYLKIRVDRLAAGRFGLNVEDVQNALRSLLEGRVAGTVIETTRRVPLLIRGPAEPAQGPGSLCRTAHHRARRSEPAPGQRGHRSSGWMAR
jgi:cobalt-zinc-cadmium resistance protein CzcA